MNMPQPDDTPAIEGELQRWVAQVRSGQLPRRDFIQRLAAWGISAPLGGLMLMNAGVANAQTSAQTNAQTAFAYKPTKRGGGGTLRDRKSVV